MLLRNILRVSNRLQSRGARAKPSEHAGCDVKMPGPGTPSDNGYVSLTWRGIDGSVLGTVATATLDSHDGAWQQYQGWFDMPASAFSVDYTMNFVRNFGYDLDNYFDDNVLDIFKVPETGTLALSLLDVAAIASVRRRSR